MQILDEYRAAQLVAKAELSARRARVLQHEDLRKQLTEQPLNFTRPEQWSGYVPPRGTYSDDQPLPQVNTSARRRALVEICAEALRRGAADDCPVAVES